MKKIVILIIVVCACWTNNVDAQVHFGAKGGLNFANFKTDDFSLDNSTGWQVGAFAQFNIPGVGLGIQPELLYTVKKADVNGQSNSAGYFEVPVNLRWGFNLLVIRPYLIAGPYFSYAANFSGDAFKNLEHFDWGIGVGGGVEIWKLQLGLRYSWGLQNVSDSGDVKNNTFSLTLGLFLF